MNEVTELNLCAHEAETLCLSVFEKPDYSARGYPKVDSDGIFAYWEDALRGDSNFAIQMAAVVGSGGTVGLIGTHVAMDMLFDMTHGLPVLAGGAVTAFLGFVSLGLFKWKKFEKSVEVDQNFLTYGGKFDGDDYDFLVRNGKYLANEEKKTIHNAPAAIQSQWEEQSPRYAETLMSNFRKVDKVKFTRGEEVRLVYAEYIVDRYGSSCVSYLKATPDKITSETEYQRSTHALWADAVANAKLL